MPVSPAHDPSALDVLVAGAGYVGLATAVSLKQARPGLAVAVVDAAPDGIWRKDGRASAIAAAACRMLGRLGCWDEIAPEAQAITEMIVTDSRTGDPVRPVPCDLPSGVCVVLDHGRSLRNRSSVEARPHENRTAKDSVKYATWIVMVSAARARAASRLLFG